MVEPNNRPAGEPSLNERLLNLFVYVPAGIAVSVVEEFPRLAERGRERLEVRVSSARAVGQFAMQAGQKEFLRRSGALLHRSSSGDAGAPSRPQSAPRGPSSARASAGPSGDPAGGGFGSRPARPVTPVRPVPPTSAGQPATPDGSGTPGANGHVPPVSTLSIPDFDTLSASQVVQRLDGLNRSELVSVRAYEASTRGRRTILSRVDQLLDERS
jgi:hypothetical protein